MKRSAFANAAALLTAVVMIAGTFLLPANGFAQGLGRGASKKSEKFINRHDARNGRWDGRGPKPKLVGGKRAHRSHGRHRGWTKRR